MSQLTLVESFPLNSKVPQVLLLCTVCGSLNGSALDYRRKFAATMKWGTSLPCFVKFFHIIQSGHLCCWALGIVNTLKCSHLIGSLDLQILIEPLEIIKCLNSLYFLFSIPLLWGPLITRRRSQKCIKTGCPCRNVVIL